MSDLDSTRVEEALLLLGEMLDYESVAPVHLVVVGGSALLAAGIGGRTVAHSRPIEGNFQRN